MSSSSWGCELKYFRNHRHSTHTSSSSSWGCELKYFKIHFIYATVTGHPLREDVSWNSFCFCFVWFLLVILFVRMWVEIFYQGCKWYVTGVILFVRMWVEIEAVQPDHHFLSVILFVRMWVEMSSVWLPALCSSCHPLREDVSWNAFEGTGWHVGTVILFVRMWVEILLSNL